MAMSAEFRSKLELFTSNRDVSIRVKIFRMGRKTTNKRTNKQIYCSFSQLHCVNRENEFQTDGTRRVNRRNELQFGKANCVNRGKRNIYPWERFHNPKERIAQTSIWWFIFSGFFFFCSSDLKAEVRFSDHLLSARLSVCFHFSFKQKQTPTRK